jgi:succinate-semialdehyde dehydrogenase/glutarate-semialdehyde dehydrogenase
VYVVEEIADAFTEQVVARVAALRQDPAGEYDVGPFIFQRQLGKVEEQVNAAVASGAKVLVGGQRAVGLGEHFFEPTVLTDVSHDMAIMCEETFGPVLPIVRVRDEEEAIRLANDTKYGLGASVFTTDKKRGEAIARRLRAGSVTINDAAITYGALELPFGGWKESGVGQVNGETGLRGYCHAQPILIDRFGLSAEYVWFPYTAEKFEKLVKGLFWMFQTPLRWLLR